MGGEAPPSPAPRPPVEVVRSPRRRRTGQASLRDGRVVVRVPSGLAPDDERRLVERLVGRVLGEHRVRAAGGDRALRARADRLADTYLDGVRATDVRWSARMQQRHGSCTPATGEIRISSRLAAHPRFVLDYVLVHELAHLQEAAHSAAFGQLVDRFPHAERARGFLAGFAAGQADVAGQADDAGQASPS